MVLKELNSYLYAKKAKSEYRIRREETFKRG